MPVAHDIPAGSSAKTYPSWGKVEAMTSLSFELLMKYDASGTLTSLVWEGANSEDNYAQRFRRQRKVVEGGRQCPERVLESCNLSLDGAKADLSLQDITAQHHGHDRLTQ